LKALLRLIPFVHPYRYKVLAGFIAFFIARLFEAASFLLVAEGIDAIDLLGRSGEVRNWRSVGVIALAIVGMVAGRFLVVIYARIVLRRIGIAVSFDLRQKLYAAVQRQGSQFFGRISVGDIMTRAIQDISLIQRLLSFGLILLVIMVYAPAIAIVIMLYKSATLTLFILPGLPIIFIYCWAMARQLAVTSLAVQQRLSDLSSHTQENLSGIRTVQAMVQEDNEIARFLNTNNAYADAFYAQARINSLMVAWMPLFAQVCQLAILVIGGKQVMDGQITIGGLFVFFYFLNMLLQPIRMAGFMVTLVQRAGVAVNRLYEIFDAEPEIADCPSGATPGTIRGEFELRHLSYTYPGTDKAVLKDINLTIKAGESFAIVGRVGSGKSTLLKQFTRLVDTAPSQLYLDGYDVRDYPLSQLRIQIAQVLQDPFLFGEPLRNNISYDNPDREVEHIWDSADAAAMRGTIEDFPHQLETLVGERGVTLSGGQKQRTALARGLIRNEPVLILDDCFSSVDTETEEHILRRLKEMRKDKTTILVSHRVSTLRHSDRILVLEDGAVAELGTHKELVALNGIYAELERLQTQGYDDNRGRSKEMELDPV
jgi:ATP-binding cassette subfamily B protein